jgi:hypothetical protein
VTEEILVSRRAYRRIAALLSAAALVAGGAATIAITEAPVANAGCCTGFK